MSPLGLVVIFTVAFLYASVGHGGASGYLAVAALAGWPLATMATQALILNLIVAGIAWVLFWREGHGSLKLLRPFAVASMPAAFVGGWMPLPISILKKCLAFTLFVASARLALPALSAPKTGFVRPPALPAALATGGAIGWLSGAVGVGGGIFLSPIMVLGRWADIKTTAATSAAFIFLNSATGLLARFASGRAVAEISLPLVAAAAIGGLLGSRFGSAWANVVWLRRILSAVLVIAAIKLVITHG